MANYKYQMWKGNPLLSRGKKVGGEWICSGTDMQNAMHKSGRIVGISNPLGKLPTGEVVFWVDRHHNSSQDFDFVSLYHTTCPLCGTGINKGDFLCDECDQIART